MPLFWCQKVAILRQGSTLFFTEGQNHCGTKFCGVKANSHDDGEWTEDVEATPPSMDPSSCSFSGEGGEDEGDNGDVTPDENT